MMTALSQHSASATAAFKAVRRHSRKLQTLFAGTPPIATLTLIASPGSTEGARVANVAVPTASGPQFGGGGFATDDADDPAQQRAQPAGHRGQRVEDHPG